MGPTPSIEGDAMAELVPKCRRPGARAMGLVSHLMSFSINGLRRSAGFVGTARGLDRPSTWIDLFFRLRTPLLVLPYFACCTVSLAAMVSFPSVVLFSFSHVPSTSRSIVTDLAILICYSHRVVNTLRVIGGPCHIDAHQLTINTLI